MALVSIVQYCDIKVSERIDAEYYRPKFLEINDKLKKLSSDSILRYFDISDGNHLKIADTFSDEGIPYYRGQDLKSFFIENSKPYKIPENIYNLSWMKRSHFKEGDLLISIVGTIGNISYVTEKIRKATGSCKIAILRPKLSKSLYFCAFFLSKYGRAQIEQNIRGAVQQGLILNDMGKILVYVIRNKDQVSDLVKKSIENNRKAEQTYKEAPEILLESLSLKDYKSKHEISFDVNLNEVLNSKRIDSEYYQPKYKIVEEKIRNVKHDTLGKIFDFVKGFEVGGDAYQEEGVPYLRVSNLEVLELDWSNPKFISEDLFNQLKEDYQPQKGEILLSKDGTPGIAYLVRDNVKSVHSSGILRLKLKDNKKLNLSYMTLVLNSILIQQQIERDSGGAIIKHWRHEEVKNTLVPILDDNIQEKIALTLDESFKLRKESKELLEKAKKMVEDEIEKEAK